MSHDYAAPHAPDCACTPCGMVASVAASLGARRAGVRGPVGRRARRQVDN